jgi:hypothetical protein
MKNLIWLSILLCLALPQGRLCSQVSEMHPQEIDDPPVNPYCGWGVENTGWIDILTGISAYRWTEGEHLLFVGEDCKDKVPIHRWKSRT